MELIQTRFLNDGQLFNRGQPATLIRIQGSGDYDLLLSNIVRSKYYDAEFFRRHSGCYDKRRPRPLPSFLLAATHVGVIAQMVAALGPRRVLEVGSGRGEVLTVLSRLGVEAKGIDFSPVAGDDLPPHLREHLLHGDIRERCEQLLARGERFDTLCGFDIWEHLHPCQLASYLEALLRVATEDAAFFFVIPAFGEDRIFGSQFPLEFEENRAAFESERPFDHLLLERSDPVIPAAGHLICAPAQWWERTFVAHGLHRLEALERQLHRAFDHALPHSLRSFFVLSRRRDHPALRISLEAKLGSWVRGAWLTVSLRRHPR
jgi:SAM-dependent methyltransferase